MSIQRKTKTELEKLNKVQLWKYIKANFGRAVRKTGRREELLAAAISLQNNPPYCEVCNGVIKIVKRNFNQHRMMLLCEKESCYVEFIRQKIIKRLTEGMVKQRCLRCEKEYTPSNSLDYHSRLDYNKYCYTCYQLKLKQLGYPIRTCVICNRFFHRYAKSDLSGNLAKFCSKICQALKQRAKNQMRIKNNSGKKRLRYQILDRDGRKCVACGRSPKIHGVVLHIDHIIPKSKGGTYDPNNLQTLCTDCNLGKSDVLLEEAKRVKSNRHQKTDKKNYQISRGRFCQSYKVYKGDSFKMSIDLHLSRNAVKKRVRSYGLKVVRYRRRQPTSNKFFTMTFHASQNVAQLSKKLYIPRTSTRRRLRNLGLSFPKHNNRLE